MNSSTAYSNHEKLRDFWNAKAEAGKWAGTRDLVAKEIEIEAIAKYVKEGMRVLDVGCGNGVTAIELARRFPIRITGTDISQEKVLESQKMAEGVEICGEIDFAPLDILHVEKVEETFDMIYTERVIITLLEWETQRRAISNIFKFLKPGGIFVMCENSHEGWEEINRYREMLQIASYSPPSDNRYLRDTDIRSVQTGGIELEAIDYYSSTYYLLSRVVNAYLSKVENKEPTYDAEINQIAKKIPSIGNMGQGRIWVWKKLNQKIADYKK